MAMGFYDEDGLLRRRWGKIWAWLVKKGKKGCRGKNTGEEEEEGEERDFVKSQQTTPFHFFFLISFFNLTRVFW
jgi:hypothetical protein